MPTAFDSQPQPIGLQPSRRESDVQAEIATQRRDAADSFTAAPTPHAAARDGTNRTGSPSIRAANTFRTPNRQMNHLTAVETQNLAPSLNPVLAKVLNSTAPTQDRTPSWYSKQAPIEQAMQQQWREPSRRSSSRLNTPPESVGRTSHETSAIRSQHQLTPSSAGPSRTSSKENICPNIS
jgi:flagellar motor protein MotB